MLNLNRVLILMFFSNIMVFGAGLEKANRLLNTISTALAGLSVITITVCVTVVAYKIMWGGNTLKECAPIIIGGGLIGCASGIGSWFL